MTTAREEAERRWPAGGDLPDMLYPRAAVRDNMRGAFEAGAEWQSEQPKRAGDGVAAAIGHRILGGENPIEVARDYDAVPPVKVPDQMVERAALAGLNSERRRHGLDERATLDDFDNQTAREWREDARISLEAALGGEA